MSQNGLPLAKSFLGSSRPLLVSPNQLLPLKPKEHSLKCSTEQFMVGESPAMRNVFEMIRRFAQCDAPILVTGETGTGKELVAQAIHERSSCKSGPFVAINCAALPESLIASELFGYEKGAFTGAFAKKIGQIEIADNGTLFLDEIGDLPIELQGHLLRFLQEGKIVRLGGHNPVKVNVRVISATNVNLPASISAGRFREDLFYRLNVLTLPTPPLRERGPDIELLAQFFLRVIARELGRDVSGFEASALRALCAHLWPGNVRELISVIRRAVVMGNTPLISAVDLALAPLVTRQQPRRSPQESHPGSSDELRRLLDALERNNQNRSRAAQDLGISRVTLYRMLHRHNLSTDSRRSALSTKS